MNVSKRTPGWKKTRASRWMPTRPTSARTASAASSWRPTSRRATLTSRASDAAAGNQGIADPDCLQFYQPSIEELSGNCNKIRTIKGTTSLVVGPNICRLSLLLVAAGAAKEAR